MKKLRLFICLTISLFLYSCAGKAQSVDSYTFQDLIIRYPSSCEITKLSEQKDKGLSSFVLVDKKDKESLIEFAISGFDKDFLSHVPREELLGELVAAVFDMKDAVLSRPGVKALNLGEMEVSAPGKRPEAYMFVSVNESGKTVYYILSSAIVGNYNIATSSKSTDPSTMELFTAITDNITINIH